VGTEPDAALEALQAEAIAIADRVDHARPGRPGRVRVAPPVRLVEAVGHDHVRASRPVVPAPPRARAAVDLRPGSVLRSARPRAPAPPARRVRHQAPRRCAPRGPLQALWVAAAALAAGLGDAVPAVAAAPEAVGEAGPRRLDAARGRAAMDPVPVHLAPALVRKGQALAAVAARSETKKAGRSAE
jgi:hypothetical protein